MAELVPLPLSLHVKRVLLELQRHQAVYDLPVRKFYPGTEAVDLSVRFHERRAATPVGPAAGPQDQLVQNIVLSWLAGGRIIELKTVQIDDRLQIPRPCIDATNVGFNVEWSQELLVAQSLREYVGAWMLLRILRETPVWPLVERAGAETIFDLSVGYDLAGIQSPKVRGFIEGMLDAGAVIDELRLGLDGAARPYRDLDYEPKIADSITLSTFHGCPADEIESISEFLLTEMGCHVIVKLNPTLLGYERVRQLLHDELGYTELRLDRAAFDHDLQFDQALAMVPRLRDTARRLGLGFGVKFTNTLVVKNHKDFFTEETMYLSGAPLHVLATQLVGEFRRHFGGALPISFSAGIDNQNFPTAVSLGLLPVTTCTDLLRPGGYGRLPRYLTRLEERMRKLGARDVDEFVLLAEGFEREALQRACGRLREEPGGALSDALARDEGLARELSGHALDPGGGPLRESLGSALAEIGRSDALRSPGTAPREAGELADRLYRLWIEEARVLNAEAIVPRIARDPRYAAAKNRTEPKKIGSRLYLFDCINCDKCIPVCPNDANFFYTVSETAVEYRNFQVRDGAVVPVAGGRFEVEKSHQIANYADFCNECGNCDVFCPETGGPYIEKPSLFSSEESYRAVPDHEGFLIEVDGTVQTIRGRIQGREYRLRVDVEKDRSLFSDGAVEVELQSSEHRPLATEIVGSPPEGHVVDMGRYLALATLLRGLLDEDRIHFTNLPYAKDAEAQV